MNPNSRYPGYSGPLSPVLRGEGGGEGPDDERRDSRSSSSDPSPQPSPLSTGERGPEHATTIEHYTLNIQTILWFLALSLAVLTTLLTAAAIAQETRDATRPTPHAMSAVKFTYLDLYIDSGDRPLGAYQLQLTSTAGQVEFVSVEGGAHAAFNRPPYYDPHAMTLRRLILAAYSTSAELPHGKTRVARVHMQITGDAKPAYTSVLMVAADAAGQPIPAATLSVSEAPLEGVAP